jgi:hypothetical protein
MNAWSTINKLHLNKATKALSLLETLISPFSSPILDYLEVHGTANLSELVTHTGSDAVDIQEQLEQLCVAGVLCCTDNISSPYYGLNYSRLEVIGRASSRLASFYKEGV